MAWLLLQMRPLILLWLPLQILQQQHHHQQQQVLQELQQLTTLRA
jgi:hypothetical protein